MRLVDVGENVRCAVSVSAEGNVDDRFDTKSTTDQNISRLCLALGISPDSIIQAEQVHGSQVVRVGLGQLGMSINGADGLITDEPGVNLMLRLADCIPVFMSDPERGVIGLVHSGWRGTVEKITLVAIQRMTTEFGVSAGDLRIWIGPSIRECCLTLDEEPIQAKLPEWRTFLTRKGDRWSVDLPGFVADTAVLAGVKRENIHQAPECTFMERRFYSHARCKENGEQEGRFAAIIGLK